MGRHWRYWCVPWTAPCRRLCRCFPLDEAETGHHASQHWLDVGELFSGCRGGDPVRGVAGREEPALEVIGRVGDPVLGHDVQAVHACQPAMLSEQLPRTEHALERAVGAGFLEPFGLSLRRWG